MKIAMSLHFTVVLVAIIWYFGRPNTGEEVSLTVQVKDLRNSKGVVQFALYNKNGSLPDQRFKRCYRIRTSGIENGQSATTFTNLPPGRYAVNVLHDEDENGQIQMGLLLPREGIGFSNLKTIGLSNRPNFDNTSFELTTDKTLMVPVIYK